MRCVKGMTLLRVSGATLLCASASAADSPNQPPANKHQMLVQLVDCVRKQHADDKGLSYQQAIKRCKEMQNNRPAESASEDSAALAKQ
jgi:hypothetical protein